VAFDLIVHRACDALSAGKALADRFAQIRCESGDSASSRFIATDEGDPRKRVRTAQLKPPKYKEILMSAYKPEAAQSKQ